MGIDSAEPRPGQVLIIANEPFFLQLLSRFLASFGYNVEAVPDGPEGIRRFEPLRCDAVIVDLSLGETSGWKVIDSIRERDVVVGTILLSASAHDLDEELVHERGFDMVLGKPVDADKLRQAVAEVCRRRAARFAARTGKR